MLVWGSRLYGKVDEIEGIGHVATQFGHLFWIPLIPLNSYFVTEEQGHHFVGTPLGLQMKSVLAGYAHAFSIIFFLAGLGGLNALLNPMEVVDPEKIPQYKMMVVLGAMAIPTFIAVNTRAVRSASYETACQWAARLNFDTRFRTYIELYYDKIDAEEAERRIEALDAATDDYADVDRDDAAQFDYQYANS